MNVVNDKVFFFVGGVRMFTRTILCLYSVLEWIKKPQCTKVSIFVNGIVCLVTPMESVPRQRLYGFIGVYVKYSPVTAANKQIWYYNTFNKE